jgi:hypothetical protein
MMDDGPKGIVGVFARSDHPKGWGSPYGAHGYVVLFVRCEDEQELTFVTVQMAKGFVGKPANSYAAGNLTFWFGGSFDLLATVPDVTLDWAAEKFWCKGDNRFVGIYEAKDVLD